MQITWFGHSAFRIDIKGAVIMIDPFLDNPTFKGDKQAAAKGATHVVVTHGHDDHIGSAVEICQATGAVLVANPEISDYHGRAGRFRGPQRADQPRRRTRSRRLQHRLCAGLAFVLDHHRRQAASISAIPAGW